MLNFNPGLLLGAKRTTALTVGITTAAAVCISASLVLQNTKRNKSWYTPSPKKAPLKHTSEDLPYPPDALPGGRDVETPYGSIRVYEWGPEDGDRVLFVHGISTPVVALGDLGHEMVSRGYRVMMFGMLICNELKLAYHAIYSVPIGIYGGRRGKSGIFRVLITNQISSAEAIPTRRMTSTTMLVST